MILMLHLLLNDLLVSRRRRRCRHRRRLL